MYAISAIFPAIQKLRSWRAQIDAVVAELKPTAQDHEDIMIEAGPDQSQSQANSPNSGAEAMSDDQTRQITDPIYYDDGDVIHACDSTIPQPGVRLVWTRCDVPENQGFTQCEGPAITYPECLKAAARGKYDQQA
jgi:hypothetical protein